MGLLKECSVTFSVFSLSACKFTMFLRGTHQLFRGFPDIRHTSYEFITRLLDLHHVAGVYLLH